MEIQVVKQPPDAIGNCDYDEATNDVGIIEGSIQGQHLDCLSMEGRMTVSDFLHGHIRS